MSTHSPSFGTVVQAMRPQKSQLLGGSAIVVLFVLPFMLVDIWVFRFANILFFAAFVVAWDLISGYTGKVSFGHTAFIGAGGYTSAILSLNTDLGLISTVLIGTIVAGILGLLVGIPTLRLEGPYFALFTVIIPLVMLGLINVFYDLTGGEVGLTGVPRITSGIQETYYLAVGVFLVVYLTSYLIVKSNAGIIFTAIREDPQVVSAVGINPAKFKIFALTASSLLIGFAGAVYAHTIVGGASPTNLLELVIMINILLAAMLGGMGNLNGAVVGAVLYMLFREWFRGIEYTTPVYPIDLAPFTTELFFLVVIIIVVLIPGGIVPLIQDAMAVESKRDAVREYVANYRTRLGNRLNR